jgi:hypothetical protein
MKPKTGLPVTQPSFEMGTSQTQVYSINMAFPK